MNAVLLIARRELSAYLRTMSGFVIIAVVLGVDALLFNGIALATPGTKRSSEVLSLFFYLSSGLVMLSSIFISMRLLAEERQTGTLALLYSSPVRDVEIVLGKFLSAFLFLTLMLALTFFMPLLVFVYGKISLGHLLVGYFGLLLLGAASIAVGTFGSALAANQVLAVIISACLMAVLVLCWWLASVSDRPFSSVFNALSIWNKHFPPFQSGILHVRDVVYYLLVTFVALFGATRVLEARRWR